jgi:hypothetical protein
MGLADPPELIGAGQPWLASMTHRRLPSVSDVHGVPGADPGRR